MNRIAGLLRDDRGAMTIEFVLWVPVIVAMLLIVVDATTLYVTHTEMSTVARDTARRMVTGQISSQAQAEAFAAAAMSLRDYPYTVEASYDPNGSMDVAVKMNYSDISIAGYSTLTLVGGEMTARVSMRSEPVVLASVGTLIEGSPAGGAAGGGATGGTTGGGTTGGGDTGGTTGNGNGNGNGKK